MLSSNTYLFWEVMFVLQQVIQQQQNNTAEEQSIFQCRNV